MTDRRRTDPLTGEVIEDPPIRPFADWLHEQSSGKTHDELSEALWDLVQRVQDTGKAGSISLTLHVGFDGNGRVSTKDEVKLKLPEFNRPATAFFVDKHGNASRRDPNQPELPNIADRRAREAN